MSCAKYAASTTACSCRPRIAKARDIARSGRSSAAASTTRNAAGQGDLTQRITVDGKMGELATLSKSVNALIDLVSSLVRQIQAAAEQVQGGAQEISSGNNNLSHRTSEQAASLEETAPP